MKKLYPLLNSSLIALSICIFSNAPAQTWIPDSLYGNNSITQIIGSPSDDFSNFVVQPDGKIIAGGYHIIFGAVLNAMARFDICGELDSTFGTNGIVYHQFDVLNYGYHYALQQDGKILSAGLQAPNSGVSMMIPVVSRYNSDGSADTNFAFGGTHALRFDPVAAGNFHTVKQLPDGRIVCMGVSKILFGLGAMRFMADGSLDTTFDGDGKALFVLNTGYYTDARGRILQNGDVVVAGRYVDAGNLAHFAAVCFDSAGAVNTSFGNAGLFTDTVSLKHFNSDAYLDIQTDDKLVMAATREPEASGIEVIRYTPSGILDAAFGTGGHVNIVIAGMTCSGIKVLASGKILIMGYATISGTGCAVRLNTDGTTDTTFGTGGFMVFDLNNSAGTHSLRDLLEISGNRLLGGSSMTYFITRRYITQSNVPHITGNASLLQTTGTGTYQWFLNDTAIGGATASTHVPLLNGSYTVLLTDDLGCTYLSDSIVLTDVGVSEINPALQNISLIANPFNGFPEFAAAAPMTGKISCEVSDITGKIIFADKIEFNGAGKHTIEIPQLGNGMYFITLIHKDNRRVFKAVKME